MRAGPPGGRRPGGAAARRADRTPRRGRARRGHGAGQALVESPEPLIRLLGTAPRVAAAPGRTPSSRCSPAGTTGRRSLENLRSFVLDGRTVRRRRLRAATANGCTGGPDGAERDLPAALSLAGGARGRDRRPVARRRGPLPLLAGPAVRRRRAGRPAARAAVGVRGAAVRAPGDGDGVHPRRRRRDPDLHAPRRAHGPGRGRGHPGDAPADRAAARPAGG